MGACYSSARCEGTLFESSAVGNDAGACFNSCLLSENATLVYDNTAPENVTNCFCYNTCTPLFDSNNPNANIFTRGWLELGGVTTCPSVLYSSTCPTGWRCDSSESTPTFEGSADSLQECVNAGLNDDNAVVYSFWEASQKICQGFTAAECSALTYDTDWASAVIEFGPGIPSCPTAGVPGEFAYVKQGVICQPETTDFVRVPLTPAECYSFCEAEEAAYFNFYSENGANVCGCSSTCSSTLATPGALVYQMCQSVDLSDFIKPGAIKLTPGVKWGAKPGQIVRYHLTLMPVKGGATLGSDVALRVDFSPYLTVQKAYVKSARLHDKPIATIDTAADIVTWEDAGEVLTAAKGSRRHKFTIVARVATDAPADAVLGFDAFLNGGGLCDEQVGEDSIKVRSSHKSEK